MSPRSQGCSAVSESIATIEVSACDLARIESCGGWLTVGAVVRERLAERSADVTKSVPLLARVVLTGVADTPFRATAAEAVLTGAAPFRVRGGGAYGPGRPGPPSDLHGTAAHRRHVAGVLIGASYRAVPGVLSPGGRNDYESAADMLSQRTELADSLITPRFPIKDAAEAFPVAADKSSRALRVVLEP
jgi:threonine dehydrogenase-like Zn-dependent dehydrogenase